MYISKNPNPNPNLRCYQVKLENYGKNVTPDKNGSRKVKTSHNDDRR